jgi:hypothetical protein
MSVTKILIEDNFFKYVACLEDMWKVWIFHKKNQQV